MTGHGIAIASLVLGGCWIIVSGDGSGGILIGIALIAWVLITLGWSESA